MGIFEEDNQQEEEIRLENARKAAEKRQRRKLLFIIGGGVVAAIIIIVLIIMMASQKSQINEMREQTEQLQLENQMLQSASEFAQIQNDFATMENQTSLLANDSLVEKYNAARLEVEKLMNELQNEKNKSAAQIKKLQDEIATLKGILRDYTQKINELMEENKDLRDENDRVKAQNSELNRTVNQVKKDNEELNERITLAEKLNVTGVNLVALNKKGKTEKNITKATKLLVSFTIPQNNSTPAGVKTIYLRIISPEGNLLTGNVGSFPFEGSELQATARTNVEYANEEIGGVQIYWDVNTTLNPGDYKVELFADNYRLASRSFTMKK